MKENKDLTTCPCCKINDKQIFSSGNRGGYCRECLVEKQKKHYILNKKSEIKRIQGIQKNSGYSHEKTVKQKALRMIKRKTRLHFPIAGKRCKFCKAVATERHHYTDPIKFNKFYFVCHDCHYKQDNLIRVQINKRKFLQKEVKV